MQANQPSQQAERFHQAGYLKKAIKAYLQAIGLDAGDPAIYYGLGNVYLDTGDTEEAISSFGKALQLAPGHSQILMQLGNAYGAAGLLTKAVDSFQQARLVDPDNAAIHFNLGNVMREMAQPEQAAASYRTAIKLAPTDADIHNNLGNVLRELGRIDEAIASYKAALQLNPVLHHAKVHLVHQKQHICDWENLDRDVNEIRQLVNTIPKAQVSPFAFLAMPGTTPAEQKKCAQNWLENRYKPLINKKIDSWPLDENKKLRIAYLSSDFRLHPLAFLITELIELHDRARFEIYAYSYAADDETPERRRLEKAFDHFVDIRSLSLSATAQKIHDDRIDILVDLTGFTHTSRSGIAIMRPAPIQINWLGFPGTMGSINGAPLFDYLLSDAFITPPEQPEHYAEQLALLPNCYQPNDRKRPVGGPPSRKDYGLSEDAFVFCCFNQTFKILPSTFDIWMRLLKAIPNSVLWLLESNRWAKENLISEVELRGIEASRLIFAPRVPISEHLARHVLADLFLDTQPYNAHTTASDAIWMGLPIITCSSDTFASRVAGSLLRASDLPELVTSSLEEYENLALHLATHPDELITIRDKLKSNKEVLPLFDTPEFTRQLEQAYLIMWQKYAAGQQAQTFNVS